MKSSSPLNGFACSCDEEGKQECANLRKAVEEILGVDKRITFATKVIMFLWWNYNISIEGIPVDQWFGIDYAIYGKDDDEKIVGRVQCDVVEDGLAMLYMKAYEKWGKFRADLMEEEEIKTNNE